MPPRTKRVEADPVMLVNEVFDGVVGHEELKAELVRMARGQKLRAALTAKGAKVPNQPLNFVFSGNPGSGKTTCALRAASFLAKAGLVERDLVKFCSAKDLVSKWVGDSAIKTADLLAAARGGVLFLDEAYSLCSSNPDGKPDAHAAQALAELVFELGKEKPACAVILAGYKDEIGELVRSNPGIASRFPHVVEFHDYSPKELTAIFKRKCEDAALSVSVSVSIALRTSMTAFSRLSFA